MQKKGLNQAAGSSERNKCWGVRVSTERPCCQTCAILNPAPRWILQLAYCGKFAPTKSFQDSPPDRAGNPAIYILQKFRPIKLMQDCCPDPFSLHFQDVCRAGGYTGVAGLNINNQTLANACLCCAGMPRRRSAVFRQTQSLESRTGPRHIIWIPLNACPDMFVCSRNLIVLYFQRSNTPRPACAITMTTMQQAICTAGS